MWYGYYLVLEDEVTFLRRFRLINKFSVKHEYLLDNAAILIIFVNKEIRSRYIKELYEVFRALIKESTALLVVPVPDIKLKMDSSDKHDAVCSSDCSMCNFTPDVMIKKIVKELMMGMNTLAWKNIMVIQVTKMQVEELSIAKIYVKYKLNELSQNVMLRIASKHSNRYTHEKYNHIALGGSFDGLHPGHYLLLLALIQRLDLNSSNELSINIGIMPDTTVQAKSLKKAIVSYTFSTRYYMVREMIRQILNLYEYTVDVTFKKFTKKSSPTINLLIEELDEHGVSPIGTMENIQALIVSEETIKGGLYVNNVRKQQNLQPLSIIVEPVIIATIEDSKKIKLSSTAQRDSCYAKLERYPVLKQKLQQKLKCLDFDYWQEVLRSVVLEYCYGDDLNVDFRLDKVVQDRIEALLASF